MTPRVGFTCPARPFQVRAFPVDRLGVLPYDNTLTRMTASKNPCVLSRHSGMPLAGIQSGAFLDSGQNHAGMTEG
jgi:hypothetical protein